MKSSHIPHDGEVKRCLNVNRGTCKTIAKGRLEIERKFYRDSGRPDHLDTFCKKCRHLQYLERRRKKRAAEGKVPPPPSKKELLEALRDLYLSMRGGMKEEEALEKAWDLLHRSGMEF